MFGIVTTYAGWYITWAQHPEFKLECDGKPFVEAIAAATTREELTELYEEARVAIERMKDQKSSTHAYDALELVKKISQRPRTKRAQKKFPRGLPQVDVSMAAPLEIQKSNVFTIVKHAKELRSLLPTCLVKMQNTLLLPKPLLRGVKLVV